MEIRTDFWAVGLVVIAIAFLVLACNDWDDEPISNKSLYEEGHKAASQTFIYHIINKLNYTKWNEPFGRPIYSDGAQGGENDYRYYVIYQLKPLMSQFSKEINEMLIKFYQDAYYLEISAATGYTRHKVNKVAKVGVLYVLAKLPYCGLTRTQLRTLSSVKELALPNPSSQKFFNDLWERLLKKELLRDVE